MLTDAEDAASGLGAGRYAAVVTIPKDFSAKATSFSKDEADEVHHATIDVQTSQISRPRRPGRRPGDHRRRRPRSLNATLTEST